MMDTVTPFPVTSPPGKAMIRSSRSSRWGGKSRDIDDEFKGAPFRDEKTKFLLPMITRINLFSASGAEPSNLPCTTNAKTGCKDIH